MRSARFRAGWRDAFGQDAAADPIYQSISDGRRHPGMEHWVPLFHRAHGNAAGLPDGGKAAASVSLDHQAEEVLAARLEMIADHFAARRMVPRDGEVPYRPLPPDRLYLDRAGWDAMLRAGPLFRRSARSPGPMARRASMAAAGPARCSPRRPAVPARACSTSCAPRP